MSSWRFVIHVHTKRSYDSITDPVKLVQHAVALGIDVLAVTDHDTWQGSVDVTNAAYRMHAPLRVVTGTEFYTDQGDVIGIFLKDDVRERSAIPFCEAVHDQGGLVFLPHPYRSHQLDEHLMLNVDLVEIYNARTMRLDNDKAAALAQSRGKAALVGPDAHSLEELGLGVNEFPGTVPRDERDLMEALLHEQRIFHTARGSIWIEWRSQAVKLMKKPSLPLGVQVVRGAARRLIKPAEYRLG